jgi:hypothetical protein
LLVDGVDGQDGLTTDGVGGDDDDVDGDDNDDDDGGDDDDAVELPMMAMPVCIISFLRTEER